MSVPLGGAPDPSSPGSTPLWVAGWEVLLLSLGLVLECLPLFQGCLHLQQGLCGLSTVTVKLPPPVCLQHITEGGLESHNFQRILCILLSFWVNTGFSKLGSRVSARAFEPYVHVCNELAWVPVCSISIIALHCLQMHHNSIRSWKDCINRLVPRLVLSAIMTTVLVSMTKVPWSNGPCMGPSYEDTMAYRHWYPPIGL